MTAAARWRQERWQPPRRLRCRSGGRGLGPGKTTFAVVSQGPRPPRPQRGAGRAARSVAVASAAAVAVAATVAAQRRLPGHCRARARTARPGGGSRGRIDGGLRPWETATRRRGSRGRRRRRRVSQRRPLMIAGGERGPDGWIPTGPLAVHRATARRNEHGGHDGHDGHGSAARAAC